MQLYDLPDETAKFATIWTTILKIRAIFVHEALTEHAVYVFDSQRIYQTSDGIIKLC